MVAARAENYIEKKSKTTYNCIPQTIYIGHNFGTGWTLRKREIMKMCVFLGEGGGMDVAFFKLFFGMSMYG